MRVAVTRSTPCRKKAHIQIKKGEKAVLTEQMRLHKARTSEPSRQPTEKDTASVPPLTSTDFECKPNLPKQKTKVT